MNIEQIEKWIAHPNHALNRITISEFKALCELALRNLKAGFSVPQSERNALERAAKVCEERSKQHAFDMNTSWQAEECAEFIRALMKEGGE